MRLFFKLFEENDLQENMNGQIIGGFIESKGNKQPGIVQLGKEVENEEHYPDDNTDYRKFINCILYRSKNEENARNQISQLRIEGSHTIRVYY